MNAHEMYSWLGEPSAVACPGNQIMGEQGECVCPSGMVLGPNGLCVPWQQEALRQTPQCSPNYSPSAAELEIPVALGAGLVAGLVGAGVYGAAQEKPANYLLGAGIGSLLGLVGAGVYYYAVTKPEYDRHCGDLRNQLKKSFP